MSKLLSRPFWRENAVYFTLCALFFLLGGLGLGWFEKGEEVLFFSARRSPAGDYLFRYGTRLGEFFGYILAFLLLLAYRLRFALATVGLGLAAMILSRLLKSLFRAPRPLAWFTELGREGDLTLVEGVEVHQWLSFPSGHTLGAFALFTFLALLLPRKNLTGVLCFAAALMVGISRVYLVQHFAEDVYFGALAGLVLGIAAYALAATDRPAPDHWLDKPVHALFRKRN